MSWFVRGQAQENSTFLSFNRLDTLHLGCIAESWAYNDTLLFAITRGDSEPILSRTDSRQDFLYLYIDEAEEVIYDDVHGVHEGFENFLVFRHQSEMTKWAAREMRYLNVGVLQPQDSGRYHCVALSNNVIDTEYNTPTSWNAGSLVIEVNNAGGLGRSSMRKANNLMTYSALLVGASKIMF